MTRSCLRKSFFEKKIQYFLTKKHLHWGKLPCHLRSKELLRGHLLPDLEMSPTNENMRDAFQTHTSNVASQRVAHAGWRQTNATT